MSTTGTTAMLTKRLCACKPKRDRYLSRLARHPGVFPAAVLTLLFFLAGHGSTRGLIAAGVVSIMCWTTVLITARTQP